MPGAQAKRLLLSQNESSGISTDSKSNSSSDSFKNNSTEVDSKRIKNKGSSNSKIISSRYRQAAVAVSQKNASNSSKESSRIASPLDRTQTKSTLSSVPNWPSTVTTSKFSNKEDSYKPKFKKYGGNKDVEAIDKTNLRLHSTAVNSSAFFDKTHLSSPEYFSTTIVAQKGVPHNHQCSGDSIATLSDISEIVPSSVQEDKKMETTLGFNVDIGDAHEQIKRNYTNEDLEKEYLEHLSWAFINKRSEEAFEKQIKEAKNQISFLTLLNEVQEEEISEEKQKIELLDCFENISLKHEKLKEELRNFNETTEPCEKAFDDLSHHLELQMNQIKLENIYIPTEEVSYKERLDSALQEGVSNLQEFSNNISSSRSLLFSVSNLVENVVEESNHLESCLKQREKLANVAIQESSLKLRSFQ